MTRPPRQYYTLFFLTTFVLVNAQTGDSQRDSLRDAIKKEEDILRKELSDNYKATITDSVNFTGQLIDFNLNGTCGGDKLAGSFIFRVTDCERKDFPDTVAVIIQCPRGSSYEKLIKNDLYKLKVTPNRLKNNSDFIWWPYENIKRYFLLHHKLTKAN